MDADGLEASAERALKYAQEMMDGRNGTTQPYNQAVVDNSNIANMIAYANAATNLARLKREKLSV